MAISRRTFLGGALAAGALASTGVAGLTSAQAASRSPLFGTDDVAIHPSLAAQATAQADDYRLEVVPDCGHFIVDERPALVRRRLVGLAAEALP